MVDVGVNGMMAVEEVEEVEGRTYTLIIKNSIGKIIYYEIIDDVKLLKVLMALGVNDKETRRILG